MPLKGIISLKNRKIGEVTTKVLVLGLREGEEVRITL